MTVKFLVRSYEDTLEVTADKLELLPDGARFYTDGRLTSAFSRYLWIQELPATEEPAAPAVPAVPEPTTEPPAEPIDPA